MHVQANPDISSVLRWIGTNRNVLTETSQRYFQTTARIAQFIPDSRMCIVHDGIPSQAILVGKALDSSRI